MSHILGIGIAALDIINTVTDYPAEDSEIRATGRRICRGGNAANTLVVLSQLGHHCLWGGVCTDTAEGHQILADLAHYHIDTTPCRLEKQGCVPTSYITLNQRNGSRTIVHYRDLREFRFSDFDQIDLKPLTGIYFEGRNIPETAQMLAKARQYSNATLFLEIEKPRPDMELLLPYAHLVLFSRALAMHLGYLEAEPFLQCMRNHVPTAQLICAWGADGAYALDVDNQFFHQPAYPPLQVIDTIGAGDTFNAGIIDALSRQKTIATALQQACQLAGRKCGQMGFEGLF